MLTLCFILSFISQTFAQSLPTGVVFSLTTCGEWPKYQTFKADNSKGNYTIFSMAQYDQTCIDSNYGKVGTAPWTWDCDPSNNNQWWQLIPSGNNNGKNTLLTNMNRGTCIQSSDKMVFASDILQNCDTNNVLQEWIMNSPKPGYIQAVANSSLCLTVAMKETLPNCSQQPFSGYPYCNQQLSVEERVNDLVSRMTLTEKVQNLQNSNPGIPRLGVPSNEFGEALHGVLTGCGATYEGNTGCATSFPHALLLGATFNRTLWKRIGEAISTEARAFANQGIAGLFKWAPDINLFRDPRWGRGQEVPGEDPYLTSQYVMQYSHYMQYGEDTKYLKLVSTAKHYADYDQEGNYGTDRGSFDANVTMQDQVDYYWPAWRSAVQTSRVQSIMCSYNAVNSMPSCGNDYFMNQIVREEWGFDGFFVSDCGAIGDGAFTRYIQQTYGNDNQTTQHYQQARTALQGGCDTNCGGYYASNLQGSVENGYATEEDVDRASKRLWRRSIELGKLDFNPPSYYTTDAYGPQKIDSAPHRDLALKAAEQGIVLLKNDNNILPLPTEDIMGKTIALIGPHGDVTQDMLSNYHGTNTLVDDDSPYMAFLGRGIYDVRYSQGCTYLCNDTTGFDESIDLAKRSDYVIVFLGLHPDGGCEAACESEGWDRNTIEFPGHQLDLLQQVFAANKNTILVLINGGSIDISWAKANVPGIVEAFYPGELGGSAICNLIFGSSAPAGKLPYTLYDKSFLTARPSIMDMSLRGNGGITYRYYTGTPVYPFGYGLYYTNFTYKYINSSFDKNGVRFVDTKTLADFYRNGYYFYSSEATSFVVEVTNTGKVASDCVVLGFVTSENDSDAPLIKLFDFERAFVDVGQSVNVTLSVAPEAISVTNKYGNERIVPGKYNLYIGDYQNRNYVHTHLVLTGEEESIFNLQKIKQKYNAKLNL